MNPIQLTPKPKIITIAEQDLERMRQDVEARAPEEACGMLAGRFEEDRVWAQETIPTVNALHSPVRYRMDPQEQFEAFNWIESNGLELVAIYHSHPNGPPGPSLTDIAEAYYPEVVYLIWSRQQSEWQCLGFAIQDREVTPVNIFLSQLE